MVRHVADNVAVVEALGAETAVVVGNNWGARIAWSSCLLRPDRFSAMALLGVPYMPRGNVRPREAMERASAGRGGEIHPLYFQHPGRAEAEIETDVRSWLLGYLFTSSGDSPPPEEGTPLPIVPPGGTLRDAMVVPEQLPRWLGAEDLEAYVAEFERTGFSGGLNKYRTMDRDWEDMAVFGPRPIEVPSLYIAGEHDRVAMWSTDVIARFPETLPGLRGSHVVPGCGHWVQQECPDTVNRLLIDFLRSLSLD